jgi:hypothetical protein
LLNRELLEEFVKQRIKLYLGEDLRNHYLSVHELETIRRKIDLLEQREAELIKVYGNLTVREHWDFEEKTYVNYSLHLKYFIKQEEYYFEEEVQERQLQIKKDVIISDVEIPIEEEQVDLLERPIVFYPSGIETRAIYNRMEAVKYAEIWWDGHNKKYPLYANDCTNFISQCLYAGEFPMAGYPNMAAGWWYKNFNSSSYSWRVANTLRWYLPGAQTGIRGIEVNDQKELSLGDIILYDFEGDGRWNHCTMVVSKDKDGDPLVNAHTQNSRKRYWSYYDSSAFTENMKYKFFHITDGLGKDG